MIPHLMAKCKHFLQIYKFIVAPVEKKYNTLRQTFSSITRPNA